MARSQDALSLVAWSVLALGALGSAGLAASIGGGWKQGFLGYAAWALFPYAALSISLAFGRFFRAGRPVQMFLTWTTVVVALGGPLLYVDAILVHVDAQGALAALMVPIRQTVAALVADAVAVVWQWRIG
jgi:hypothetical protein